MEFKATQEKAEAIYNESLAEISGIKFTSREVDIIACIVNNRGDKKTASILSISYRTVGAHVRNIMSKLGCSSRDQIIDFAEKSGKVQHIRNYYLSLVVHSCFQNQIKKIKTFINHSIVICSFDIEEFVNSNNAKILGKIERDLKAANIELVPASDMSEGKVIKLLKEESLKLTKQRGVKKTLQDYIFVALDNTYLSSISEDNEYIDFRSDEYYYFSLLDLISKILDKPGATKILDEFKTEYDALHGITAKPNKEYQNQINTPWIPALSRPSKVNTIIIAAFLSTLLLVIYINKRDAQNVQIKAQTESISKLGSYLPLGKNSNFIEWKNTKGQYLLDEIDEKLKEKQIVVIRSFPGTGKTTLGSEYGHRYKEGGAIVRWINSGSADKIRAEYVNIALTLNLDLTQTSLEATALAGVVNSSIGKLNKELLIIFDNAKKYEEIKDYISNLPENVKVLISTKSQTLEDTLTYEFSNSVRINLEPFNEVEAQKFISKSLNGRVTHEGIKNLIELYKTEGGVLPLKLKQVVSIFKDNPLLTIEEYKRNIAKYDSVDVETSLLIEILVAKFKIPWEILQYAAYLDPDFIDVNILGAITKINDIEQIQQYISDLTQLSLAEIVYSDQGIPGIRLHKLIKSSILKYIATHHEKSMNETKIIDDLLQVVNEKFPDFKKDVYGIKASELYPHAMKLIKNYSGGPKEYVADLCSKLGRYNHVITFRFAEAMKYYHQAIGIWRAISPADNKDIADNINDIALVYYDQGKYNESLKLHKQALSIREKLFNDNDLSVAISHNNVGITCSKLNLLKEAAFHYKKSIKIFHLLGKTNIKEFAITLNNLANTYMLIGQYDNALREYENSLKIKRQLFKGDHPAIANTLTNIGDVYYKISQHETALRYYNDAYQIRLKLYGLESKHPSIANSLNRIGKVLEAEGKYDEALEKHTTSLQIMEEIFKDTPDHPEIAISLRGIGKVYESKGIKDKALKYYEAAYRIRVKIFGETSGHQLVTESLDDISNLKKD